MSTRAPARKRVVRDALLATNEAIELARTTLTDAIGEAEVGEHVGARADGDRLVTHSFVSQTPGYRGWRWEVTLARAPRSRAITVCETAMTPGDDALLSPPWIPWADRLQPGDLGAGDVLPYVNDDYRLEPGYQATDDEDADRLAIWELGLGRPRVLSPEGRSDAAQRWYDGEHGPRSRQAIAAKRACASCGFFTPLAGSLRSVFGACTNEWSPSDGKVVSVDHGCGAHSETDVERRPSPPMPEHALDENAVETVDLDRDS